MTASAIDLPSADEPRRAHRLRITRLAAAWGLAVVVAWAVATFVGRHPTAGGDGRGAVRRSPVQVLASWDGTIYESIAADGYRVSGDDRRLLVFFPLFPLASRLVGGRQHAALAGIILSQLSLLAAMLLLSALAGRDPRRKLTGDPALWMLCAPMALFFHTMYSESLFILLTIGAALAFRESRFAITAILACLAGLTRPTAVTFCVPFALAAVAAWRRGDRWLPPLLCGAAPLVGIVTYVVAVGWMLGDPLAYTSLRSTFWHYRLTVPFATTARDALDVAYSLRHMTAVPVWLIARLWTVGIAVVVLAWGWRRVEPHWIAYVVASLIFIHASDPAGSTARYEVVLFPLFILFALSPLARPKIAPAVLILFFTAQMFLLARFGQWVWVG